MTDGAGSSWVKVEPAKGSGCEGQVRWLGSLWAWTLAAWEKGLVSPGPSLAVRKLRQWIGSELPNTGHTH